MELAQELRASLQDFLAGATIEIRENGSRITASTPLSWEVRGEEAKPLLHLWADNCNVTRRVLAIADHSEARLALAVERFGRANPERLEMVRLDFVPAPQKISRGEFCDRLRRILAEQFPDDAVEKISTSSDLGHSLSRMYTRGIMRHGAISCAFLAVQNSESPDTVESSLTYALLWVDRARQTAGGARISSLRLILPKGKSSSIAHRLAALGPRCPVFVYELDPVSEKLEKVDPCASGNIDSWLVPRIESLRKCRSPSPGSGLLVAHPSTPAGRRFRPVRLFHRNYSAICSAHCLPNLTCAPFSSLHRRALTLPLS